MSAVLIASERLKKFEGILEDGVWEEEQQRKQATPSDTEKWVTRREVADSGLQVWGVGESHVPIVPLPFLLPRRDPQVRKQEPTPEEAPAPLPVPVPEPHPAPHIQQDDTEPTAEDLFTPYPDIKPLNEPTHPDISPIAHISQATEALKAKLGMLVEALDSKDVSPDKKLEYETSPEKKADGEMVTCPRCRHTWDTSQEEVQMTKPEAEAHMVTTPEPGVPEAIGDGEDTVEQEAKAVEAEPLEEVCTGFDVISLYETEVGRNAYGTALHSPPRLQDTQIQLASAAVTPSGYIPTTPFPTVEFNRSSSGGTDRSRHSSKKLLVSPPAAIPSSDVCAGHLPNHLTGILRGRRPHRGSASYTLPACLPR
eukprot:TRINITY_DN12121_c0_g1_i1.p1 TRINITY_DN12121_c0_g1~~TRINITY_DN12121_c0_g1_i1.p1  ORF type:complete len:367 (+),score=78.59 TRINITY_DN12121_c0_g1_i1:47-1147(+)